MKMIGKPPRGKHLFGMVTVGEKGQIVIPKKARECFDIHPGDALFVCGDEKSGLALITNETMMKMMELAFRADDYPKEDKDDGDGNQN